MVADPRKSRHHQYQVSDHVEDHLLLGQGEQDLSLIWLLQLIQHQVAHGDWSDVRAFGAVLGVTGSKMVLNVIRYLMLVFLSLEAIPDPVINLTITVVAEPRPPL